MDDDNLIPMCANCHSIADAEKWDEEAIRNYKKAPWTMKASEAHPESKKVSIVLKTSYAEFGERESERLMCALSAFLGVPVRDLKISNTQEAQNEN